MFEDLETVIESRARSVDLTVNNYYEFLYSFHIAKENYRKGHSCFLLVKRLELDQKKIKAI
jgi:hypothetical protein